MAMSVGQTWRASIACYMAPQLGLNIRHFVVSAQIGSGLSEQAFCDALSSQLAVYYIPLIAASARYWGIKLQEITTPLPLPFSSVEGQGNGTVPGDPIPSQVAGVISVYSKLSGRTGRGRVYVPFPGKTDSTPTIPPTPVDDYVSRLNGLGQRLTGLYNVAAAGNGWSIQWCLFRKGLTPVTTFLYSYVSRQLWGNQRRRGNYGRPNVPPW